MPQSSLLRVALLSLGCLFTVSLPAADYFSTSFQSECEYIVETVVADLAEMYTFAATGRLPDSAKFAVEAVETTGTTWQAPVYNLTIKGLPGDSEIKMVLPVSQYAIWEPATYAGVAAALAKAFPDVKANPSPEPSSQAFLEKLTSFTAQILQEENLALSKQLESSFTSPVLHNQAAALLGVFGLRENSGDFFDLRHVLCRMAAHLAFARSLDPVSAQELSGRYSDALLYTLMNNQTEALEKISALEKSPDWLRTWNRILQVRNTGDYRPFKKEEPETLAEEAAYFRALCESVSPVLATDLLQKRNVPAIPDWFRAVQSGSYSVGLGHWSLAHAIELELRELNTVCQAENGKPLSGLAAVPETLNALPGHLLAAPSASNDAPTIRVIDRGQWAMQIQRHLAQALRENYVFMKEKWGVPEQAAEYKRQIEPVFSDLRLYPFVARRIGTNKDEYHRAVDRAYQVTITTPHLVSPGIWNQLCYPVKYAPMYQPSANPHINEWHSHNPPPRTAYNPKPRFDHPSMTRQPDSEAHFLQLWERAPFDSIIAFNILRLKYGENPPSEEKKKLYAKMLPFSAWPNGTVAESLQASDPKAYEQFMQAAAAIRPSYYYTLADYWRNQGDMRKAVEAAEKGMDEWPDSLSKASAAVWLCPHYLKTGYLEKAESLAELAAEVYSFNGLAAAANLKEIRNKYPEAESYYQKIKERYSDNGPLAAFYGRAYDRTGEAKYRDRQTAEVKADFPDGMRKVRLSDFSGPPAKGAVFTQETPEMVKANVRKGDVVVALDDYEVGTFKQYAVIRRMSASDVPLKLIIWRDAKYQEISAQPSERRFGVDMKDFKEP